MQILLNDIPEVVDSEDNLLYTDTSESLHRIYRTYTWNSTIGLLMKGKTDFGQVSVSGRIRVP
jgi:hypothetical protein